MRQEEISHRGRIVSIEKGMVKVEIVSESACAACHASGLCGMGESRKKIVEVRTPSPGRFELGQDVEVCLARRMGHKAVLLSYVIPLAVLLILILSLQNIGMGELAVGGASLAGVALYYLVLYFLKDSLSKDYEFYIKG